MLGRIFRSLVAFSLPFLATFAGVSGGQAHVGGAPPAAGRLQNSPGLLDKACGQRDICTWEKVIGGKRADKILAVAAYPDGGFVLAGSTRSRGRGREDAWVLRLGRTGAVLWTRILKHGNASSVRSITVTRDDEIVVAGDAFMPGPNRSEVWVVRLSEIGETIWQRTFGGVGNDRAFAVAPAQNSDVIVAGFTRSRGEAQGDIWVLRVDPWGHTVWEASFGGTGGDSAHAIAALPGGSFAITGYVEELDSAARGAGKEFSLWVGVVDGNGVLAWERRFARGTFSAGTAIEAGVDNDLYVSGVMQQSPGQTDKIVLMRLSLDGVRLWEKNFGGAGQDRACCLATTANGDVVLALSTNSFGAGSSDAWLLRYRADGHSVWERIYGGAAWDRPFGLVATPDGGFFLGGVTTSKGAGFEDGWLLRLDENARVRAPKTTSRRVPNR